MSAPNLSPRQADLFVWDLAGFDFEERFPALESDSAVACVGREETSEIVAEAGIDVDDFVNGVVPCAGHGL